MKEEYKEQLRDQFNWDKDEPFFDNVIRIGAGLLVYGFIFYIIIKGLEKILN